MCRDETKNMKKQNKNTFYKSKKYMIRNSLKSLILLDT